MNEEIDGMRAEAFLADAVEAVKGKLYALGVGFDQILTKSGRFPIFHGSLGIGVVVHVPYRMTNTNHEIELVMLDQDGVRQVLSPGGKATEGSEPITALTGGFNVGRPPKIDAGDEQVVALAFELRGLKFPNPDLYVIVVSIDSKEMCRLPLRVRTLR